MKQLVEGQIAFSFEDCHRIAQYDRWSFYRNRFQAVSGGSKGVDIVCLTDRAAWLLEVTDYRGYPLPRAAAIAEELETKIRDTLAGLAAAAKNADEACERKFAFEALKRRRRWRVALHFEQPRTALHRQPYKLQDLGLMLRKRKRLKAVDAHPIVCSSSSSSGLPWTITRPSSVTD